MLALEIVLEPVGDNVGLLKIVLEMVLGLLEIMLGMVLEIGWELCWRLLEKCCR